MQKVYATIVNADRTEGRGPVEVMALFTKEEDARKAGTGKGVQHIGDGEVEEQTVFESYDEYEATGIVDPRARALSKLTLDEQKALGLI